MKQILENYALRLKEVLDSTGQLTDVDIEMCLELELNETPYPARELNDFLNWFGSLSQEEIGWYSSHYMQNYFIKFGMLGGLDFWGKQLGYLVYDLHERPYEFIKEDVVKKHINESNQFSHEQVKPFFESMMNIISDLKDDVNLVVGEKYNKENRSFSAKKTATLLLELNADSGYSSDESHRVSPDQWHRISKILAEK